MVGFKSCHELIPGEMRTSGKESLVINPPYLRWASQLLRCKGGLVYFCAVEDTELVLNGTNPGIGFKGIICLVEQRWLGG